MVNTIDNVVAIDKNADLRPKLMSENFFSRHFFCFMNKVLKIGGNRPYEFEDLFEMDDDVKFVTNYDDFKKWKVEVVKKNPTISVKMLMFRWGFPFWIKGFIYFNIGQIFQVCVPIALLNL